jgi:hypothetical protein
MLKISLVFVLSLGGGGGGGGGARRATLPIARSPRTLYTAHLQQRKCTYVTTYNKRTRNART